MAPIAHCCQRRIHPVGVRYLPAEHLSGGTVLESSAQLCFDWLFRSSSLTSSINPDLVVGLPHLLQHFETGLSTGRDWPCHKLLDLVNLVTELSQHWII